MTLRTALAATLLVGIAATQGGVVGADRSYRPESMSPTDRCHRCERLISDPFIGAETLGEPGAGTSKFRTIRCMLAHLGETSTEVADIYVVDGSTGKLVNANDAVFVRVAIDAYAGEPEYGIGDTDYVAFRSSRVAEKFAADRGVATMSWAAVRFYSANEPARPLDLHR